MNLRTHNFCGKCQFSCLFLCQPNYSFSSLIYFPFSFCLVALDFHEYTTKDVKMLKLCVHFWNMSEAVDIWKCYAWIEIINDINSWHISDIAHIKILNFNSYYGHITIIHSDENPYFLEPKTYTRIYNIHSSCQISWTCLIVRNKFQSWQI